MSEIDLLIEDDEDVDNLANKFLMFNLGDEEYGIDLIGFNDDTNVTKEK